jgi:hypothetical protein
VDLLKACDKQIIKTELGNARKSYRDLNSRIMPPNVWQVIEI